MSETQDLPVFGKAEPGRTILPRPSAYALVRNEHQEFAIVRTGRGLFLPGGGIEGKEKPDEAAARETKEECGLLIKPVREVGRAIQLVNPRGRLITFEKLSSFWWSELIKERVAAPEPGHELVWLLASEARDRMFHESQAWALRHFGGG